MRTIKALELKLGSSLSAADKQIVKDLLKQLLREELLEAEDTSINDQKALTGGYTFKEIDNSIDLRLKLRDKHIKLGLALYPVIDPIDLNIEEPLTELVIEVDNNDKPIRIWWS